MGKKKILCCLTVLLNLTIQSGNVSGIPRLRTWSTKIVDWAKTHDPECVDIAALNGKKGLIAIAAGLSDSMGRIQVFDGVDVPQNLLNGWSKAADAVIYGKDSD